MEFMSEHASLVVLAFLGSIFVIGAAVLAALFGAFRKRKWLALGGLAVAALLVSGYALVERQNRQWGCELRHNDSNANINILKGK